MRIGTLALIVKDKKVLMGKKGNRPGHFLSDAWHFPGGKSDDGETPEQTVIREMKEELGMDIKIIRKLCEYDLTFGDSTSLNVVFVCESDNVPIANDDLVDAKYFTHDEILELHHKASFDKLPVEVKEFLETLV